MGHLEDYPGNLIRRTGAYLFIINIGTYCVTRRGTNYGDYGK